MHPPLGVVELQTTISRVSITKKLPNSIRQELAALAVKPESEIDFSNFPASTEQDWCGAVRGKFYRPIKQQQLTGRIDADVWQWLKSQGKGYQRRLNNILRTAMLDQAHPRPRA